MKLKLIVLSLLASNLVYANDLKIISHEVTHITWSEYLASLHKVQTKNAMCTAYAEPANESSQQEIVVHGNLSYFISNTTKDSQNYWVDEYMCINGYGCTHVRDTIVLSSEGSGGGGGDLYNKEYLQKGTYVDEATIQISGESTCFVQDSNKVTVY